MELEYDSSKFFLKAINVLLQAINELPISDDIELAELVEAQVASEVLVEVKKEVLSEGWNFNTDKGYTFPQDANGYISVPVNVLDISSSDSTIIMRDWRLYNRSENSAIFDEPKDMDVIWDMGFNSLTHPLRNFITIRAARKFQARTIMDKAVYGYTQEDEQQAHMIARRSDGFTGRYNMLTSSYGVDNSVIG